jgi:hypothetical protein
MKRPLILRFGPALACALALTACGGQAVTTPPPADQVLAAMANPPAKDIPCGTVAGAGGTLAKVTIRQGAVDCGQAGALIARYFTKLTPSDLSNPDGAGPIALDPWTCGSAPAAPLAATCSTEDGREVDTQPSQPS